MMTCVEGHHHCCNAALELTTARSPQLVIDVPSAHLSIHLPISNPLSHTCKMRWRIKHPPFPPIKIARTAAHRHDTLMSTSLEIVATTSYAIPCPRSLLRAPQPRSGTMTPSPSQAKPTMIHHLQHIPTSHANHNPPHQQRNRRKEKKKKKRHALLHPVTPRPFAVWWVWLCPPFPPRYHPEPHPLGLGPLSSSANNQRENPTRPVLAGHAMHVSQGVLHACGGLESGCGRGGMGWVDCVCVTVPRQRVMGRRVRVHRWGVEFRSGQGRLGQGSVAAVRKGGEEREGYST